MGGGGGGYHSTGTRFPINFSLQVNYLALIVKKN